MHSVRQADIGSRLSTSSRTSRFRCCGSSAASSATYRSGTSSISSSSIGQPHEIATAALFLASDDSSFVTGIELFVGGGTAQI